MAHVVEKATGALARLIGEHALKLGVFAVVVLVLYGAVPTGRVAWLLLFFVSARGLMLVREAILTPISPADWERRYRALLDQFRSRTPEAREEAAAEWGAKTTAPEDLAEAALASQRRLYRPPRSGRVLAFEAIGLITLCLVAPFDLALYTRDLVSLRSSQGYLAFGLAVLCVALYAWPHRWKASEQREDRQALWWALPAVPAIALAYLGVTTLHAYLDPRRADRLELRANRVLALENNVTAGAHADWVFEYARELERKHEWEQAIYYYQEGVHLAPRTESAHVRLAALRKISAPESSRSSASADPRLHARGLTADEFARLGFWSDDAPLPSPPACRIDASLSDVQGATVVLLRVGDVPASMIDAIADVIQRELGLLVCAVPEAIALPDATRVRGVVFGRQWDTKSLAEALLAEIPPKLPAAPIKFLLVTPVETYSEGTSFVYSSTYRWGSVLSYARFGDLASNPDAVRHRTAKQALGALVKSFGVPTSPDPNCVTSYANGPGHFDRKGNRPNLESFALFRERVDAIEARWRSAGSVRRDPSSGGLVPRDAKEAMLALRAAAAQGDPTAQRDLGRDLMTGKTTRRNPAEGIRWIRKAAAQGDAEAQMYLGSSYARGDGVAKDLVQAEVWLRRAAEQGNLPAHFQLATVYHAQRRWDETLQVLRYAADRDQLDAQVLLATLYREGRGVPVDQEESVHWLQRAADQGSANAQNNLGMALSTGDGIERDPAQAAVWFEQAARQGQVNAQLSLAAAYLNGSGVDQDLVRGLAWLEIAASLGFEPAIQTRDSLRDQLPQQTVSDAKQLARDLAVDLRRSPDGA